MIGKLKGIIDSVHEDHAVIDVGGVGYNVLASSRTLASLEIGTAATFIIETHVREDHIHLFGFVNAEERDWFRLLSTVQRVGAKVALAILAALTPSQISQAILAKDTSAFSKISGIGGKLAERIVAELKDKALKVPTSGFAPTPTTRHSPLTTAPKALEDTISALVHLGYSRSDAYAAAIQVAREVGEDAGVDILIKKSLSELANS